MLFDSLKDVLADLFQTIEQQRALHVLFSRKVGQSHFAPVRVLCVFFTRPPLPRTDDDMLWRMSEVVSGGGRALESL